MPTDLQELAGDPVHGRLVHAVEEARAPDRLPAEEEVAGDGELRDQRRVLVDRLDPERDGVGRAVDAHLAAAEPDLAAGGRHHAREHLYQRRLAGAVVAKQAHDLALADTERDVLEGLHLAVELADALHADQVTGHRSVPPLVPALEPGMERHHAEDDGTDEDVVGEAGHADQHDAVPHDAQDEDAQHRADDRAAPAGQHRAADHHHGDHLELVARAAVRVGGRGADRADHTRKGGRSAR